MIKTHYNLVNLGKAIALHAHRIKKPITPQIIEYAIDAWFSEIARNGGRLRCSREEYRAELDVSVRGCDRKPWFKAAAEKWLRWTKHRDFPHEGLPHEKILFAIRQHCAEASRDEFYLGARDAGLVAGVSYITGWRMLCKLCASGYLKKMGLKRLPLHAETYLLLKK